jgi:hypothetical protein
MTNINMEVVSTPLSYMMGREKKNHAHPHAWPPQIPPSGAWFSFAVLFLVTWALIVRDMKT